ALDATSAFSSSDLLQISQKSATKACERDLASIRSAILTTGHPLVLMEATGLLNTITPVTLLKQLCLSNRKDLATRWKTRLVQYAILLQSAQLATRMLRFLRDKRMHLLNLEAQSKREWDPLKHPDWILVEIDANISIRQHQADMAVEMIRPPEEQNSIMQLNMGEGKSSLPTPPQHSRE
ncbi:10333_t:CDS:2, partial [Acaulospora colombiana]